MGAGGAKNGYFSIGCRIPNSTSVQEILQIN